MSCLDNVAKMKAYEDGWDDALIMVNNFIQSLGLTYQHAKDIDEFIYLQVKNLNEQKRKT
jgi:hypothetical protein